MADRGAYRSIKVVLWDGPDFQELPERARWVFVTLKATFGPAGIEVHYPEALAHELAAKTGASLGAVKDSMDVLERQGWIRRERNVLWIVGQLKHEPALEASNKNHRKSIQRHVAGLPRIAIVRAFIVAHPEWFTDLDAPTDGYPKASEGLSNGIPIAPAINEERRTKNDNTTVSDETDGEPSTNEDTSLASLDVTDDAEWAKLRTTLFAPLRKHIWKGNRPPERVPKDGKWEEGRELSIMRDWIRGGLLKPHEAAEVLRVAPNVMGWTGPASLSWLAPDGNIGRIREIVGRARKGHFPSVAEVVRAS